MTKYEWERQLKKGISGLPKAEQQRVLDYYNELFADKIDAGLREQYIISEFGNPYDVANKIITDYYNGDKDNPEVDAYIYADSDDIDAAFDEEPAKATVDAPKRKTLAERKEERHEEQKARHEERRETSNKGRVVDCFPGDSESETNGDKAKRNKNARSASGLIVLICVLVYCVLGACFNLWHPGWLIFLAIPCVITLIEAINKRNWKIFAYPVFATMVFLLCGFYLHRWHPAWLIFLTIPLYYVLGDFITKNTDETKRSDKSGRATKKESKPDNDEKTYEPAQVEQKKAKSNNKTNVVELIAKILMTICLVFVGIVVWWWVIGLFIGGIGMIIGGIGCIVGACVGTTVNLLLVGAGLAVLGLGLICAFGMVALFKPCFNMCKSFARTIKKTFSDEGAA